MSSGKKDSPKAPDYTGAAVAQGQSSMDVTNAANYANRPNQVTPFGTQAWSTNPQIDPATGKPVTGWTQTTTLTPELQDALDAQQRITMGRSNVAEGLMGAAGSELSTPVNWSGFTPTGATPQAGDYSTSGLSPYGTGPGDPNDVRNRSEQALYQRSTARLDPQYQQAQSDLDIRLRNQGLQPGTEAYDREMRNFDMAKNDAYASARNDAITGGGNEAAQQFGMGIQGGQFANSTRSQQLGEMLSAGGQKFGEQTTAANYQNQVRQQQIAEALQKQGWSLNAINAAISGQQVGMPSMPGFSTAQAAQPTNYFGAAQAQGQQNLGTYNAQQQGLQGLFSGLGQLGTAAMLM